MRLPARRHWWSGAALTGLATIAIPTAIVVIQASPGTSLRSWLVLLALGMAMLVAWWNAARQDEERAGSEGALNALVTQVAAQEPETPRPGAAVQNLGILSNEELRRRAEEVARRMRVLEIANEREQRKVLHGRREKDDWEKEMHALMEASRQADARWLRELRPDVAAVWDELRERVYAGAMPPGDISSALRHGRLVGAWPLSQGADEIERAARQLV